MTKLAYLKQEQRYLENMLDKNDGSINNLSGKIIEHCALLTARIQQQIDDDLPTVYEQLLEQIAPEWLKPYPVMRLVQFQVSPGQLQRPLEIKRLTRLRNVNKHLKNTQQYFRTTNTVLLLPLDINDVKLRRSHDDLVLKIKLIAHPNINLSQLEFDHLKFFILGEKEDALIIYQSILQHTEFICIDFDGHSQQLTDINKYLHACNLQTSLFSEDDSPLLGFQLLRDYFMFPEKYLFFKISCLDQLNWPEKCTQLSINIHCKNNLQQEINFNSCTLKLHVSSATNLYEKDSEPIYLNPGKHQHLLPIDIVEDNEVLYNLDRVTAISADGYHRQVCQPFSSHQYHHTDQITYQLTRYNKQNKPHYYLTLTGKDLTKAHYLNCQLTVCNNMITTNDQQENYLLMNDDHYPSFVRANTLSNATPFRKPPDRKNYYWHLISHLNLNYETISHVKTLQNLLSHLDWSRQAINQQRIKAIQSIDTQVLNEVKLGVLYQIISFELTIKENGFLSGADLFLFGNVLYEFFKQYVAINYRVRLQITCLPSMDQFYWFASIGKQCPI